MASFPAALTTQLKAINTCLSAIGESPVNSLDTSGSIDVANAQGVIDEVTLAVQAEGWSWNIETNFTLSVTTKNIIPLPDMCLSVSSAYWSPGTPPCQTLVERNRQIYDSEAHTFTFTKPVIVDMLVYLSWEEMPEVARRYITIRAAQQFQGRYQSSSFVNSITEEEVARARTLLEQMEDVVNPHNSIYDNPETYRRLYGRGVRRRL